VRQWATSNKAASAAREGSGAEADPSPVHKNTVEGSGAEALCCMDDEVEE